MKLRLSSHPAMTEFGMYVQVEMINMELQSVSSTHYLSVCYRTVLGRCFPILSFHNRIKVILGTII
jgi:hypothetical protein